MGVKLLEIDVKAIKFICEVKKQSTSTVHLTNISDEYVAFKVKTTSPKRFCVRPNAGIVSPKSSCDFTVTMQGLRSAASEVECKDKFLIQSTVVGSDTKEEDVTLELFSKKSGKYVEEKKLRVILESKQDSSSDEHKTKVVEKESSNESSIKEENVVDNKALEKEPSNESSIKQEGVVKKDENVPAMHTQTQDIKEVKGGLTTKDTKASADLDEKERNLSKNLDEKERDLSKNLDEKERDLSKNLDEKERNPSKNLESNTVKVVKVDPEKKLRLCNQLKELKLKETALENQLKEAKSTISNLTCQNSIIIEAKEKLKIELARRSKKGLPFAFVCIVSIIGLISGYISDP